MNSASTPVPLREPQCPVCGQANGCAVARSGSFDQPCWCTSVKFSAQVMALVPEGKQGTACICKACAEANPPGP